MILCHILLVVKDLGNIQTTNELWINTKKKKKKKKKKRLGAKQKNCTP